MIITPHRCKNFIQKNFAENLNETCKLKGRCQLISDKKSCTKFKEMIQENEECMHQ